MLFGVKPFSRTTAAAALSPSDFASCCVNAGSGAARVDVVPVPVLVEVVGVGVGAVLVVFVDVCGFVVVDVCETGGTLDTVTVLVPEPHATTSAAMHAHSATEVVRRTVCLMPPMVFAARPRPPHMGGTRPAAADMRVGPASRDPTGEGRLEVVIISDC